MVRASGAVAPLAAAFMLACCVAAWAAEPLIPAPTGNVSGPHFVSLRAEGVNGRRGPGADQKVDGIYHEAGLPLMVTGESGAWRRVRDPDGAQVWIHASSLDDKRTAYVSAAEDVPMKSKPADNGRTLARLAHGVVGALTGCQGDWRRIAVGDHAGWVQKDALWGAEDCTGL